MRMVILVELNKDILLPFLIYNAPFEYSKNIILTPVTMKDIIQFQVLTPSITVRKNSIFHKKEIIKMNYLNFLLYSFGNDQLEKEYGIAGLSQYFLNAIQMLHLCCVDANIEITQDAQIIINGEIITPKIFDDLRRIIIIQNDIDFDIDEFMNYDTEQRLLKAQHDLSKNDKKANIEDYIDSLVIAMKVTEQYVMSLTIRKFWRYIKRYKLHESYTILKTGECSGMVTFKEPIQHWMISLDEEDKYQNLKTNEEALKNKIK